MKSLHAACLLSLLLIPACGPQSDAALSSGTRTEDGATAHFYASRDGKVFFVLWHDVAPSDPSAGSHGSSGLARTGENVEIVGEFQTGDGKLLRWSCFSPDAVNGVVKINDVEYDLAQGGLFAVTERPAGVSVTQIDRALGDSKSIDATLDELARTEPAVRRLFEGGESR